MRPDTDGHVDVQFGRARGAGGARRGVRPSRAGSRKVELQKGTVMGAVLTGDVPVELMRRRRDALSTRRRRPGDGPGIQRDYASKWRREGLRIRQLSAQFGRGTSSRHFI